jgi:hypothetical protein
MATVYEPTTEELKSIWKRAGLWRKGHRFEDDIQVPVIRQCLTNAVLAQHKHHPLPQQGSLQLEG